MHGEAAQDALFYEDFRGALKHLVGALGGPKAVGGMLRPSFSVKQAEQWVHDCLNIDRQTKFDIEDIATLLAEGRERGVHCAMYQLCDETQYMRPDIAPRKTPEQILSEQMERAAAEYRRCADELAAMERRR